MRCWSPCGVLHDGVEDAGDGGGGDPLPGVDAAV